MKSIVSLINSNLGGRVDKKRAKWSPPLRVSPTQSSSLMNLLLIHLGYSCCDAQHCLDKVINKLIASILQVSFGGR